MSTPSLFDPPPPTENAAAGRALRDAGTARVSGNTDDAWKNACDAAIHRLAEAGDPFTADDVRAIVGPPPNHPNALGARFLAARKSGKLVEHGYTRSTRPDAHARRLVVYRGAGHAV